MKTTNPIVCPHCQHVPHQSEVTERAVTRQLAKGHYIETCGNCGGRYGIQINLSAVILRLRPTASAS